MRAWVWRVWRRLGDRRARLLAWVAFGVVVSVGMWRVESTANEAESAAAEAKENTAHLAELVDQLEAERIDRCVAGRGDTRRAIVRVVDEFTDLDPAELERLGEVVDDEIPTVACVTPP